MTTTQSTLFQSTVTALTYQGYGVIQHPSGKVFFVKGGWPGDVAEFSVANEQLENKQVSFANLLSLISPSKQRVAAVCAHQGFAAGQCQGCAWMIADYSAQLEFKQKRVHEALQNAHIHFQPEVVQPIWGSETTLEYRNRVQFKTDGRNIGTISPNEKTLVPIEKCIVLTPPLQKILKQLRKTLPNPKWLTPNVTPLLSLEFDDEMIAADIIPNQRRPFKQGHISQNPKMKAWLKSKVQNLNLSSPVLELFCGSGNFTEVLVSAGFQDIAAIESDATAIFSLKQKGYKGVQALAANLYDSKSFPTLQLKFGRREILVLDPPREGLQNQQSKLLQTFPKINHIFYISCDPESWARDLALLQKEGGYQLVEVQPIDLFPQTPHVEILSVLAKI